MNRTNYLIIKLLLQNSLSIDELSNYLNLNQLTIFKAIDSLNEILISLKLPIIKKYNNMFTLSLTKTEQKKFFYSCNIYSQKQRIDYLMLKLIVNGYLKLDLEKDNLNISNSTIKRDFLIVKKNFNLNMIEVDSIKWKGIFLKNYNSFNLYNIMCEILIKFSYEVDYLPGILYEFFYSISKDLDLLVFEKNIYNIFSTFNLILGETVLKFLTSIFICTHIMKDFKLSIYENKFDLEIKDISFNKIYTQIINLNLFPITFSKYLSLCIWSILNNKPIIISSYLDFIYDFEKYFNVKLDNKFKYNFNILLFLSEFRKKSNIYIVKKNSAFKEFNKPIFLIIDFLLEKNHISLLYGDKILLLHLFENFFIEYEMNTKKNILVLLKEVNQNYIYSLKRNLDNIFYNFNFEIFDLVFLETFNENLDCYDLILSDSKINFKNKYFIFKSIFDIEYMIKKYLIDLFLRKNFQINSELLESELKSLSDFTL